MKNEIFTAAHKSLRLFRLKTKDGDYFQHNMVLRGPNGVMFAPTETSLDGLVDITKKLFGTKGYGRWFKRFVFTKKFEYKPSFVPGSKTISLINPSTYLKEVVARLPSLKTRPTAVFTKDPSNVIFDVSRELGVFLPSDNSTFIRPNVTPYAECIIPEIITRLFLFDKNESPRQYLKMFRSSNPTPPVQVGSINNVILPVRIDTLSSSLFTRFLDVGKPLPRAVRIDRNAMMTLGLARMAYALYLGEFTDTKSGIDFFLDQWKKTNIHFVFHNDRFGFVINLNDLKERKIAPKTFFTLFRAKLIQLIANNTGVGADSEMDAEIEEDLKKDQTDTNVIEVDLEVKKVVGGSFDQDDVIKQITPLSKTIQINVNESLDKKILEVASVLARTDSLVGKMAANTDAVIREMAKANLTNIKFDLGVTNKDGSTDDYSDFEEEKPQEIDENIEDEDVETHEDETVDEEEQSDKATKKDQKFLDAAPTDGRILTDEERKELLVKLNKRIGPSLSPKEERRVAVLRDKYKSIKGDDKRSIEEIVTDVKNKTIDVTSAPIDDMLDQSIRTSVTQEYEQSYYQKTMKSDIFNPIRSFSDENKPRPLYVIDYKEKDSSDQFTKKKTIEFQLEDELHKRHSVKLDIPVPDDDGFLLIDGNRRVLKKQLLPLPIMKLKPDQILVTTKYNKCFVYRQGSSLNRTTVILKKMIEDILENSPFLTIRRGNNIKNNRDFITTIEYDDLAKNYSRITVGAKASHYTFYFNQREIREIMKSDFPGQKLSKNDLPIGIKTDSKGRELVIYDMTSPKGVAVMILDIMIANCGDPAISTKISAIKTPKRRLYSKIELISYDVPLIVFLSALYGLKNVMAVEQIQYTFSPKKIPGDERLSIRFLDGYLYYPEYPFSASLLMNGLSDMVTEDNKFEDMNGPQPYLDYLQHKFKTQLISRHHRAGGHLVDIGYI